MLTERILHTATVIITLRGSIMWASSYLSILGYLYKKKKKKKKSFIIGFCKDY